MSELHTIASKMNEAILAAKPETVRKAAEIIEPFLLIGMRYKIEFVRYYGAVQYANVTLFYKGKQKRVNPRGIGYAIFS